MSHQKRFDPILLVISGAIFSLLILMAFLVFSVISMIAIGLGAAVVMYQMVALQRGQVIRSSNTRKFPSPFFIFLLASPIVLGAIVGFDTYHIQNSISKAILLWGLTMTFWSTLLFIPLALYSKRREMSIPELASFPRVSIIVPAYNEEKVIERTIQAIIDTKYQDKEIILVDDGSKDKTWEMMSKYKKQAKVLQKTNGGKASAINFGLAYATGEIIVIVDADTIIGHESLIHLVKGFSSDKNVAAVAGNIKVRNRKNWLTWCQAIEYVAGIQIARRALDVFGAISVVPGALGSFRKNILEDIGSYHKDTLVEDFDLTLKILKTKMFIAGSTDATAYTEAPESLKSMYKQRKRWYGGNLQVFSRHSDALTNPRFGILQKFVFPYMIFASCIMPFVSFITIASAIYAGIFGDWLFVLLMFAIFSALQCLQVALAVRLDNEDPRLILYGVFLVVGFKQILDILLLGAVFEHLSKKEQVWTSADRVGM
ncbi:Chitin synthase (fragment) [Nitrosotalea devaniterrae]|uniref:Chitin synthase n=1 Tax=Nitrosotalea devaniterrae TaxID=1078905 RepID=A0A128A2A8_9ARCH